MGVPVDLRDILSGFHSASSMNANNTLIEEAFSKALDRTGSSDNAMEVDFDMGLHNIFNLRDAYLPHHATPWGQVQNLIASNVDQINSTMNFEVIVATTDQQLVTFSTIEYLTGTNSILVFVNGVYQVTGLNYSETGNDRIEFLSPLDNGDVIVVMGARFDAADYAGDAGDAADNAQDSADDANDAADRAEAAAGYKLGINDQFGLTYTLVEEDEGDMVRMHNADANTVTVPANSSVAFDIGTIVHVRQVGTGETTIVPDAGVTVNSPDDNYVIADEEYGIAIVKVASDEWDMVRSFSGIGEDAFNTFVETTDQRLTDLENQIDSSAGDAADGIDGVQDQLDNLISYSSTTGTMSGQIGDIKISTGPIPGLDRGQSTNISFGVTFDSPPAVVVSTDFVPEGNDFQNDFIVKQGAATTTGFVARGVSTTSGSTSGTPTGSYIAIGV